MKFKKEYIISSFDKLPLEIETIVPDSTPIGIVQFSHGMAEHKERYNDFMYYLANRGYVCIIHDHRGHGRSVKQAEDLGYFYSDDISGIVDDLYQVSKHIKSLYPELPLYLFGHSMGSLVVRCYMKKYDNYVDKVVLCGPPTKNSMASAALSLAKLSSKTKGPRFRNHTINALAFYSYQKKFNSKSGWLSRDKSVVRQFGKDPLCGFIFTNNAFINLFTMIIESYKKNNWNIQNKDLKIFIIAGSDDPVIQNIKLFHQLELFLNKVGYKNTSSKLYPGCRHELLNELNKNQIYKDIIKFLNM